MGSKRMKSIDKGQFEKLCELLCTLEEIAGFFGTSPDVIERWCIRTYRKNFKEAYAEKSANGKISLRRFQMRQAESNPVMAIWLGKQHLKQVDRVESNTIERIEVVSDVPKIEAEHD